MKVVIMAGGKGTRITSVTKKFAVQYPELYNEAPDIPKPLLPIDGIPVLEREICSLREQGFDKIIITVGYLSSIIMDYFGDGTCVSRATGKPFGVSISYFNEAMPLGNAGALYKIYDDLKDGADEDFLLLTADSVFDVNIRRFVEYHKKKGGWATLFTHPNSHPFDSSVVVADMDCRVIEWLAKEDKRPVYFKNRVNAGLHILNRKVLDIAVKNGTIVPELIGTSNSQGSVVKVDLDRQLLKPLCGNKNSEAIFCYDSPEYVKDMGTPERFEQVLCDFKVGMIKRKNLQYKQRAFFLDRDGTINKYKGFIRSVDQIELIDGVAEAVKKINASGSLCIIITNQPVVARGEVSDKLLGEIHNKLETELSRAGAYIDALYYCPHHPDRGFTGEISSLKINCNCRKPKIGLVVKAAKDYNIDLTSSWFIGDSRNDVLCGKNAGTKTVLLIGSDTDSNQHEGNKENSQFGQDLTCNSLIEAVEQIL